MAIVQLSGRVSTSKCESTFFFPFPVFIKIFLINFNFFNEIIFSWTIYTYYTILLPSASCCGVLHIWARLKPSRTGYFSMHFERESFAIHRDAGLMFDSRDGLLTIQYLIIYDGAGTSEHGRRTPLRAHNVTAQFLRTGNHTLGYSRRPINYCHTFLQSLYPRCPRWKISRPMAGERMPAGLCLHA